MRREAACRSCRYGVRRPAESEAKPKRCRQAGASRRADKARSAVLTSGGEAVARREGRRPKLNGYNLFP